VAEKSRQKAKKGSTGMSRRTKKSADTRRTSHAPRGSARSAAPAPKITGSQKGAGEGVLPGMPSNKKTTQRQGFKTNEFIVYPAHGVGQIMAIEEQEVAGAKLELFVINFVKDKMTLRVPTAKIVSVGMRKLAEAPLVKRALETLKGRARIKRTMWSRRAQEYEAKINSGDIVAIAEVVRDLFRSDSQPEQSYSERQLYEAALDRLSREIAAVQKVTETEAIKEIEGALAKGPRRGPKPADEADAESAAEEEAA
jgi:CarD family transcriptional regulator